MKNLVNKLRSIYQSSDENRLQLVTVVGFIIVPVVSMIVLIAYMVLSLS